MIRIRWDDADFTGEGCTEFFFYSGMAWLAILIANPSLENEARVNVKKVADFDLRRGGSLLRW
ncbi:hypothetical protein OLK001_09150 [Synechocystis sp. LKSZ1]